MSHVIGRRGHGRETYPERGIGSGAPVSIVPLSRQRFIDGGTVVPGQTGSVAEPYATIAAFIASRGNASVADATANYVGWLMPALDGYTEDVAFPPYASTELRADSISTSRGTAITGGATWVNMAGAFAASPSANVVMHNIAISGDFTVTDDIGAPTSTVIFSGDELDQASAVIGGGFISNTCVKLTAITFLHASILDGLNAGNSAGTSPSVVISSSICAGDVTAGFLRASDTLFISPTITTSSPGTAAFFNCQFQPSEPPLLTCFGGATFDGSSWANFIASGGARSVGTRVLVQGGNSNGSVEGAALTGASTNVSLNGTGATVGFTGSDSGNHYTCSSATPTTVTLLVGGGELPGDTMRITKANLGANVLAIVNGGPGAGTLGTIPTLARGSVLARFNGTNWVFVEGGSMLA